MIRYGLLLILVFCGEAFADSLFDSSIFTNNFTGGPVPEDVRAVDANSDLVSLEIGGQWTDTEVNVVSGQLLGFNWGIDYPSANLIIQPKQYSAIYKLDHRFDYYSLFVYPCSLVGDQTTCTADYTLTGQNSYSSPVSISQANATSALNQYFSMLGRGIKVSAGDTVNILITNYNANTTPDVGSTSSVSDITELNNKSSASDSVDNAFLNMSAEEFCRYTPNLSSYSSVCTNVAGSYRYSPGSTINTLLVGIEPNGLTVNIGSGTTTNLSIPNCVASTSNNYLNIISGMLQNMSASLPNSSMQGIYVAAIDNHIRNFLVKGGNLSAVRSLINTNSASYSVLAGVSPSSYPYLYQTMQTASGDAAVAAQAQATTLNYCRQDAGLGVKIFIDSNLVKPANETFQLLAPSNKYVYTFVSPFSGTLNFATDYIVNPEAQSPFADSTGADFNPAFAANSTNDHVVSSAYANKLLNSLNFGRYIFDVRIGRGSQSLKQAIFALGYEYYIQQSGQDPPMASSDGSFLQNNSKFSAPQTGKVWLRAVDSGQSGITGTANVFCYSYTGTQTLSNMIQNYLLQPIISSYSAVMRTIYDGPTGLIRQQPLKNFVYASLSLYIMISALYIFVLGLWMERV